MALQFLLALLLFGFTNVARSCAPFLSLEQTDKKETQRFICNTGYSLENCRVHVVLLRKALVQYNTEQLDGWTWILVRSQEWGQFMKAERFDPDIPAFTWRSRHQIFIEEALVSPVPGRSEALTKRWQMPIQDLLVLALTHEMGHAVCQFRDEQRADEYGRLLRSGRRRVPCEQVLPWGFPADEKLFEERERTPGRAPVPH